LPAPAAPPRFLDRLRLLARQRGFPEPTVAAFAQWSRRFIGFHGKRHPQALGLPEIGHLLEAAARTEPDPVRALAASREALDFLCREILHRDPGELPLPRPPRLLDQVSKKAGSRQGLLPGAPTDPDVCIRMHL
jgi:hypothetical protein